MFMSYIQVQAVEPAIPSAAAAAGSDTANQPVPSKSNTLQVDQIVRDGEYTESSLVKLRTDYVTMTMHLRQIPFTWCNRWQIYFPAPRAEPDPIRSF